MQRKMKVNLKLGLLAAVLAMAINVPQLSAQTYLGSSSIGKGYTHLIAISSGVPGPACYLGYNTINGNWEIGTITSGLLNNKVINKQAGGSSGWSGWSQMSSFDVGTTPYYVQYDKANGRVQINKVGSNCDSVQTVFDDYGMELPANLTHVVAMSTPDGTPLLLTYDNSQADVQLYVIETNLMGVPSGLVSGGSPFPLGAGFMNLMPYNFNGSPCFIAYDGVTAEFIQLNQFTLLTYSMTNVGTQTWGPGWVALVPALTTQEFLGYSRSNPVVNPPGGVIAVDRITSNNGMQSALNLNWMPGLDTNVSLFAPFYFQNVDNSGTPTIPGFISYYQDSGQIQVWTF